MVTTSGSLSPRTSVRMSNSNLAMRDCPARDVVLGVGMVFASRSRPTRVGVDDRIVAVLVHVERVRGGGVGGESGEKREDSMG